MAPDKTCRLKGNVCVAVEQKSRMYSFSITLQQLLTNLMRYIGRVTIDILPEEVLLDIFDLYVDPTRDCYRVEIWCTLVHVCRKWRNIVLESPLRLNLRIRCHPAIPAREKLDIWSDLPVVVAQYGEDWEPEWGVDNVLAALEQNHRICNIDLCSVPTWQMEEILEAMHKSFPVLTKLWLLCNDETSPLDPDLFLGGSIPSLRQLGLCGIPFPEVPKLLLSATHLTELELDLSPAGYISPEAMTSCLVALTNLETLILNVDPESLLVREHRPSPPPTRTLLPALTDLEFDGVSEYLEDLVVRIDTPILDNLKILFFHKFIPDTPQLTQFINRLPKLKAHNVAHVDFHDDSVHIKLGRALGKEKGLGISYEVVHQQVLTVAQVCASSLFQPFGATVECLYICDNHPYLRRRILGRRNHWLELLRPFTSVKSLYLSLTRRHLACALHGLVEEGVARVLPNLKTLFLEKLGLSDPVELFESIISEQQSSDCPAVAVSHWERRERDDSWID